MIPHDYAPYLVLAGAPLAILLWKLMRRRSTPGALDDLILRTYSSEHLFRLGYLRAKREVSGKSAEVFAAKAAAQAHESLMPESLRPEADASGEA